MVELTVNVSKAVEEFGALITVYMSCSVTVVNTYT